MENVKHDEPPKQFNWTDEFKNEFATKLINKDYAGGGWSIESFMENFIKEKMEKDETRNRPQKWFDVKQIETWVGESMLVEGTRGGKAKLIVMHQCGENKDWLIGQLNMMIQNIETNGENWAG